MSTATNDRRGRKNLVPAITEKARYSQRLRSCQKIPCAFQSGLATCNCRFLVAPAVRFNASARNCPYAALLRLLFLLWQTSRLCSLGLSLFGIGSCLFRSNLPPLRLRNEAGRLGRTYFGLPNDRPSHRVLPAARHSLTPVPHPEVSPPVQTSLQHRWFT